MKVTLACCVLHNFLQEKVATQYTPPGTLDAEDVATGATNLGDWRDAGGNALQSTGTKRRNKGRFTPVRIINSHQFKILTAVRIIYTCCA